MIKVINLNSQKSFLHSDSQIESLECEIQEKRKQMRALERRIVESGEASVSNASMVEMQQVVLIHFKEHMLYPSFIGSNVRCFDTCLTVFFLLQTVMKLMAQCSEKGFELEVLFFLLLLFSLLSPVYCFV